MTFVSYAQNFEDVMLWRALKQVSNGFYIDIGAQDPVVDSVSRVFYENGWRGIHVEPTRQYSEKLRANRPDEMVLQVAVGNYSGEIVFHEFEDTGLSTADVEIAERHLAQGLSCVKTTVPILSLDRVFDNVSEEEIHWLKLDVEGLEKSVLESWVVSDARPWILVIESTKPLTQEESYSEWEPIVLSKGYVFSYFDGLNRFYVSSAHIDLIKFFSVPPNIFDDFVLSGLASQPFGRLIESRVSAAKNELLVAKAEAASLVQRLGQAEHRASQEEHRASQEELRAQLAEAKGREDERCIDGLRSELSASHSLVSQRQSEVNYWHQRLLDVHASTSWKITKPLRFLGRLLAGRGARQRQSFWFLLKHKIRTCLLHGMQWVMLRPAVRKMASRVLRKNAGLHLRLRKMAINAGIIRVPPAALVGRLSGATASQQEGIGGQLEGRALDVFLALQKAINKNNQERR